MTAAASVPARPARDTLSRLVAAGLAGGAVDFVYATGMALADGRPATRPWRTVAGGWLGRGAAEGGSAVVALGVTTHFGIALVMAAAYVFVARRLGIVARRPLATAPVYGLILYAGMYLVVLPLRWPQAFPRWNGLRSGLDILAHVAVALAIAAVLALPERRLPPRDD